MLLWNMAKQKICCLAPAQRLCTEDTPLAEGFDAASDFMVAQPAPAGLRQSNSMNSGIVDSMVDLTPSGSSRAGGRRGSRRPRAGPNYGAIVDGGGGTDSERSQLPSNGEEDGIIPSPIALPFDRSEPDTDELP